jgi:hypothetical protein
MLCFVSGKVTRVEPPELLSLALVALDGREHYVELGLTTEWAMGRIAHCSDFVRTTVLGQWGRAGTVCATEQEAGPRTAQWLLGLGSARIEIAFAFQEDYALLQRLLREPGQGDRVTELAPVDIAAMSLSAEGSYRAEACYEALATRGLGRHHALADALALRAAYLGVSDTALRMARAVRSDAFRRLVAMLVRWADPAYPHRFDAEAWLQRWFLRPLIGFDGRRPLDLVEEPEGLKRLEEILVRITFGVYS